MAKSHTPSNLAFIMKEIHFIICFYQAFEKMTWPNIKQSENTEMFKSKLRYQVKDDILEIFVDDNKCLLSRFVTETSDSE